MNERGETRLGSMNERVEGRLTNERRRHKTSSSTTTTTTSTEETKAKLPALEEKVVWPVQELVAILGGVLGFWGGVGSMGALFLLVLMTQRFFCRRKEDKKEVLMILRVMLVMMKMMTHEHDDDDFDDDVGNCNCCSG